MSIIIVALLFYEVLMELSKRFWMWWYILWKFMNNWNTNRCYECVFIINSNSLKLIFSVTLILVFRMQMTYKNENEKLRNIFYGNFIFSWHLERERAFQIWNWEQPRLWKFCFYQSPVIQTANMHSKLGK